MSNLADHIFLNQIKQERLDAYLEKGFFRNANMMFRTQLLPIDGKLNNVVNIRLDLRDYKYPKRMYKILRKNQQIFSVTIGEVCITPQKESLFAAHAHRFKGFLYKSLRHLLFGDQNMSVFDTQEICVYDNDKLVAFSFFDRGKNSVASILGVFDQAYNKFSLGTYTMLLEIQWAMQNGHYYYYPGYIMDQSRDFEYKLRLGDVEYLHWDKGWMNFENSIPEDFPGCIINAKITMLEYFLKLKGIKYKKHFYPYFSLGHIDLGGLPMFVSQPIHLHIQDSMSRKFKFIVEPLLEKNAYHVALVEKDKMYNSYIRQHQMHNTQVHRQEYNKVLYYHEIYKTGDIEEIPLLLSKLRIHAKNYLG